MSLVHKPQMTEKNLAAHRANGSHSHGAVTPEGKARQAAARLRHGFYSQKRHEVLVALGEDPQEYADLMNSLEENLADGLAGELAQHIGNTLWQMKRAERLRDSQAARRVQEEKAKQELEGNIKRMQLHENLEQFEALAASLARRDGPTHDEVRTFIKTFDKDADQEMKALFVLLRSVERPEDAVPAAKNPGGKPSAEELEQKAARREARTQVNCQMESYRRSCIRVSDHLDNLQSPDNVAAMMAPRDVNAVIAQRVEDASLRQLTRLTDILVKVQNSALGRKSAKNEGCTVDVHENQGCDDIMPENESGFESENLEMDGI